MARYKDTTFKKYITEALSKDFSNSKTMFDQAVKNFKETKEVNATSLNLLSDILRYVSKFIEEHNVVTQMPELKKAKEAAREAMTLLDKAYEKLAAEDSSLPDKKAPKFDDDMPDDMFSDKASKKGAPSDDSLDIPSMSPDDSEEKDKKPTDDTGEEDSAPAPGEEEAAPSPKKGPSDKLPPMSKPNGF